MVSVLRNCGAVSVVDWKRIPSGSFFNGHCRKGTALLTTASTKTRLISYTTLYLNIPMRAAAGTLIGSNLYFYLFFNSLKRTPERTSRKVLNLILSKQPNNTVRHNNFTVY